VLWCCWTFPRPLRFQSVATVFKTSHYYHKIMCPIKYSKRASLSGKVFFLMILMLNRSLPNVQFLLNVSKPFLPLLMFSKGIKIYAFKIFSNCSHFLCLKNIIIFIWSETISNAKRRNTCN
jgi:hypothetical protein